MELLFSLAVLSAICEVSIGVVEDAEWMGQMFPDNPEKLSSENEVGELKKDKHGRILMGVKNKKCDDATDPLGLDGSVGIESSLCFGDSSREYRPNIDVHPIMHIYHIPKEYNAPHHCMNESITYEEPMPTYGPHRPLWAKYGEYTYVPKQRWIHNLEHGSIVMLYHPCADKNSVRYLKNIIESCLRQYVITTSNDVSPDRPIVLLAWGARLEMSVVESKTAIDFIRSRSFKAPEFITQDGQYVINLIKPASNRLLGKEKEVCWMYM